MSKKILVIAGHPDENSFSSALAKTYFDAARQSGADISILELAKVDFNPNLTANNKYGKDMEPVLTEIQQKIKEAEHLVFVYPNWWGTFPGILKSFIDRVFIKGFAYDFIDNNPIRKALLKGKTARLIVTMDTPKWYYYLVYKQPGHYAMKKCTLKFCGIKPVKITTFSPIKNTTETQRKKYLQKVLKLGQQQI